MNPTWEIRQGDVLELLRAMPSESVHCVVTSPPYYMQRNYGIPPSVWGGDPECAHKWTEYTRKIRSNDSKPGAKQATNKGSIGRDAPIVSADCDKCDGWKGWLGLEPTLKMYLAHIVEIFQEVKRVLRKDGTVWLNIGDKAVSGKGSCFNPGGGANSFGTVKKYHGVMPLLRGNKSEMLAQGFKPKDMFLLPARVAEALQAPYHIGPIKEPTDRAWLAGLIDADGSIGIRVQHPRPGEGNNDTFIPYLTVTQADTAALERCVAITGLGKLNLKSKAGTQDRRGVRTVRDTYVWRLDGQIASKVIRDIYPYLVLKQLQAQVVYTLNLSLKMNHATRFKPVPPDVVKKRRVLYETIKALNQREPVDLPQLAEVEPNVEDGWWVRRDIIWRKPNPTPESVHDRPTSAHEYVFLLSKAERYFYDDEAVKTPPKVWPPHPPGQRTIKGGVRKDDDMGSRYRKRAATQPGFTNGLDRMTNKEQQSVAANLRDVWTIPPQQFKKGHFATYPEKLVEPCLLAGTSAHGVCAECGAPWKRIVDRVFVPQEDVVSEESLVKGAGDQKNGYAGAWDGVPRGSLANRTLGWEAPCEHFAKLIPATVLDPFSGTGTTGLVALKHHRSYIGLELSEEFVDMSRERIIDDSPLINSALEVNR